jgi:hypothetical protein
MELPQICKAVKHMHTLPAYAYIAVETITFYSVGDVLVFEFRTSKDDGSG